MARLLPLILLLTACGGAQSTVAPEHGHGEHGHGEHGHGEHGHAEHGHGDLEELMHKLYKASAQARDAVIAGEYGTVGERAREIAHACDDHDTEAMDASAYGPDFARIDRELHAHADALGQAADAQDDAAMRQHFEAMVSACVACHDQAPAAGDHITLSKLRAAWPE